MRPAYCPAWGQPRQARALAALRDGTALALDCTRSEAEQAEWDAEQLLSQHGSEARALRRLGAEGER